MQKYLIISLLQRDNGPTYLQFGRLRSNRFGENRLTDACRAVFPKQAAPRSHAFFSCHEPLPPGTRSGELRGGLSSRVAAAAGLSALTDEKPRSLDLQSGVIVAHVPADCKSRRNHRSKQRRNIEASRGGVGLPDPETARSTEFPLRRLAVRGCERTMRSIRGPHQRCGGVSGRFACKSNQRSRQPE